MLGGIVYAIGGLIMDEPVQGAVVITLFLIAALVIGGASARRRRIRHREMGGWWLMALSGLVSIVMASLLYASSRGRGYGCLAR